MSEQMRPRVIAAIALVVALVAATVATATDAGGKRRGKHVAAATLIDAGGRTVGRVTLRMRHGQLLVTGRVRRLTPGFHGFHVHAVGVCDRRAKDPAGKPAPFTSAGGHLSRAGDAHGAHAGDMPPLLVTRDGTAFARFKTDRLQRRLLFDADRSAVIVHADPDNLANIPSRYRSQASTTPGPDTATLQTGDSGARVACGVLRRR